MAGQETGDGVAAREESGDGLAVPEGRGYVDGVRDGQMGRACWVSPRHVTVGPAQAQHECLFHAWAAPLAR